MEKVAVASEKHKSEAAGCLAGLISLPFIFAVRGWVLAVLWKWFVAGQFHLPVLSVVMAIGLMITVHMLVPTPSTSQLKWSERLVLSFLYPLTTLGIGVLLHLLAH